VAAALPSFRQPSTPGALAVPTGLLDLGRKGSGAPLPRTVQRAMEVAFQADFSTVRVHMGPQAAAIGAIAFTHGVDLHFAPGEWNPNQVHGRRLLAHELAHVVQQREGRVRNPFGRGTAIVQDPGLEAEAERMALLALRERVTPPRFSRRALTPGGSLLQAMFYDPGLAGKLSSKNLLEVGGERFPTMYTGHLYGSQGTDYCAACHGGLHDYDIRSTTTTNAIALTWLGVLEQNQDACQDKFMLGVLYAGGRYYAANSGERYWPVDQLPPGTGYIHDAPEAITTRGGFSIPHQDIQSCQVTNRPLNCAGAKLVSYAVTKQLSFPYYMTEIWFGPKNNHATYKHGAIIESCDTCKHLLMALMCPLSQEDAELSRANVA